jgi:endonuclease/exonuclease/phosphatase family metal-dependent hydrolase
MLIPSLWSVLLLQVDARLFGRDRLAFDSHTCLDLRDAASKRSLEELVYNNYHHIVGEGSVSTKNVTRAEKASARWHHEVMRSMAHGGGFSKDITPQFVGILYSVSFTETVLMAGHAPTSQCHKLSLLRTSLDFSTVIDHTLETCDSDPLIFGYAYGGLDIPELDVNSIYTEDSSLLHLMSYNIWNFEAPYQTRLGKIVHQIVEHNPDILMLQEVRWSNFEHPSDSKKGSSITDFAKSLYNAGYKHWVWRPAMLYAKGAGKRTFEGLAIFSKFPILDIEVLELSRHQYDPEDHHQRITLRAAVEAPTGIINVFNSHFSLHSPSRDSGCVDIRDFMHYYAKRGPVVLAGDFNDEREKSRGIPYLLGETNLAASTGLLKDSFDWLANSETSDISDTDTTGIDSAWTFTTLQKMPKKRIDFILHNPSHSTVEFHGVVQNKLEEDDTVQPSDHRALFVSLRIQGTED